VSQIPNKVKYSSGVTTNDSIKVKNFAIGMRDGGSYAPTSGTGFWMGISPPTSGYTIYGNKAILGPVIYVAQNDSELIDFAKKIISPTITTVNQALLEFITGSTDAICVNRDYESIATSGLTVNIDAGYTPSYPKTGNTWYDVSYSGNNVTLFNSPSFNSGNGGNIVFDGVNDYGWISTSVNAGNPNTVCAIVKLNGPQPTSLTSSVYSPLANGSDNWLGFSNKSLFLYATESSDVNNFQLFGTIPIDTSNTAWYFITSVISGNTASLYVNGSLDISVTKAFTIGSWGGAGAYVGARLPSQRFFKGSIANISVYNRALSQSEILQNYQSFLPRMLDENILTNGLSFYLDAGYRSSYPTTGTTWYDLSGYGNNGTLINGPSYSGASGGYINFDGVDDYVSIANSSSLNPTQEITISCFVRLTNLRNSTYESLVVKTSTLSFGGSQYGLAGWRGGLSANGIFFRLGLSSGISTVSSIINNTTILNRWVYVTATYNGSSMRIYYNSVLQNSTSATGTINTVLDNLVIGRNGVSGGDFTSSNISLLQIYNRSLSQTEILQNYQAKFPQILGENIVTNGLVSYLDAGYYTSYPTTGTTWYDVSGYGRNGTLINGVTYNSSNGGSLVFDGVDDYATTTASPTDLGMVGGSFSICCWFYCNNLSTTNGGLVNSRTADSAGNTYEMGVRFNSVYVGFYAQDQYVPILNNTWYYVVHTYNFTTKSSKIYLNNTLSSTITRTTNLSSTANIRIGTYSSIIRSFNGNINIVQIYNKELSVSEIQQNFNAQKSRFGL
jgi:hypothetical protein